KEKEGKEGKEGRRRKRGSGATFAHSVPLAIDLYGPPVPSILFTASSSSCAATCIALTFRFGVLIASAMRASFSAIVALIGTFGRVFQFGFVGRPGRSPWLGVSRS